MSDCISIVSEGDLEYDQIDFIEEGGEARATRGLFTVDPPAICYLGRFSLKKDNKHYAKSISIIYEGKWGIKDKKYIFAYEISKDGVPHVHFICYHNKPYASSTMSDFWKKTDIRENSGSWHKIAKTNEDIKKYLLYTIKDNDIIYTNLTTEEIQHLKDENDEIKEDMERSALDKVLFRLSKKIKLYNIKINHLSTIAQMIHNIYVNEYDKAPPIIHMRAWCLYCWDKLDLGEEKIHDYYRGMFLD